MRPPPVPWGGGGAVVGPGRSRPARSAARILPMRAAWRAGCRGH